MSGACLNLQATSMPGKDELVQALLAQGLTIDDLVEAGIVQEGEYDRSMRGPSDPEDYAPPPQRPAELPDFSNMFGRFLKLYFFTVIFY